MRTYPTTYRVYLTLFRFNAKVSGILYAFHGLCRVAVSRLRDMRKGRGDFRSVALVGVVDVPVVAATRLERDVAHAHLLGGEQVQVAPADEVLAVGVLLAVVVEHNQQVVCASDWVVDLGPEGGEAGGRVMFAGTPADLAAHGEGATADCLRKALDGQ